MGKFEDILIFEVDFNDRDGHGRLKASRTFGSSGRKPNENERVLAHDDEGNECEGNVVEVNGSIVYIDLDRATWKRLTMPVSPVTVPTSLSNEPSRESEFQLVG